MTRPEEPTRSGPYLTPSRVIELERKIAATEARIMERIDQMDRELSQMKRAQVDGLRAQAAGLMDVLRELVGETPRMRRTG